MTPVDVAAVLREWVTSGVLDLPGIGGGATARRWTGLLDLAASADVSVARLAEAHVDAVGILESAGDEPVDGAIYGVWAAVGPGGRDVELVDDRLTGAKPFCSGLGIVDRALIDVAVGTARQLVDVDVSAGTTVAHSDIWTTTAMSASSTGTCRFDDHVVDRLVGAPGWYLDRPGFWHGACGPAACWAGAATGLIASSSPGDDPTRLSRHGAAVAEASTMRSVLKVAGDVADGRPTDTDLARRCALATRAAVHDGALRLVEQLSRAGGPRFLLDPIVAQRVDDTRLYVRQFHADADLIALARASSSPTDA